MNLKEIEQLRKSHEKEMRHYKRSAKKTDMVIEAAQKAYDEAIRELGGIPKFFRHWRIGRLTITIIWR